MSYRIARTLTQVLISLAIAIPLSTGLVCGRSGLSRAGDASLNFVGHLVSGFRDFTLNSLDPAYPRCF